MTLQQATANPWHDTDHPVPDFIKKRWGIGHLTLADALNPDLEPGEPNLPLLRATLDLIEREQSSPTPSNLRVWEQRAWFVTTVVSGDGHEFSSVHDYQFHADLVDVDLCGTAACFCGWAMALSDVGLTSRGFLIDYPDRYGAGALFSEDFYTGGGKLLGLPGDVTDDLFAANNSLSDIIDFLDEAMDKLGYIDWRASDERRASAPPFATIWEREGWS